MLPMFLQGVPDGFDLLQHMRFAAAYHDALLSGDIIPSWAGSDNFGYGSIGVRYYPPLAYILLAGGKIVSGSWYFSFLANSFMWMLAGCIGVYLLAREWVGVPMAVFASILYAIAPYHTFQIYQAVLFAEFAAAGVIPFCFLFLTRVCRSPNRRDAVLLAISTSLLVLTHIPSAIIGAIGLGVFAVLLLDRKKLLPTVKYLAAAGAITLSATAFHWIKLITETSWVRHNTPEYYANGFYDFQRYFFPMYLISPAERYVQRLLWHLDITIVLTLLFAVPAVVLIFTRKARTGNGYRSLAGVFAVSILMLSLASSLIWKAVPFLAKLQFPWRWLLISTVIGPVLFVAALSFFPDNWPKRLLTYSVGVFVLSMGLYSLTQNAMVSSSLPRERFESQVEGMNDKEACSCWWPVWTRGETLDIKEKAVAGGRDVSLVDWKNTQRSVTVERGEAAELRLATFYHPYWAATVNGIATPVSSDETGAITLPVPAEVSQVVVQFREPYFLTLAKGLSVVSWLMLFGVGLSDVFRWGRKPSLP